MRRKISGLFAIVFLILAILWCILLTFNSINYIFDAEKQIVYPVSLTPSPVVTITSVPTTVPHYITIIPTIAN